MPKPQRFPMTAVQRCGWTALARVVQDDGSLELLRSEVTEAERAELQEAVRSCPTEALRLEG